MTSLKRPAPPLSRGECIICLESNKDILFSVTEQGLRSLKESSEERRKLRDTVNTETIDRILNATERNKAEELHWHKSCYVKYTDKGKITRIKKLLDSTNSTPSSPEINESSEHFAAKLPQPTGNYECFVKSVKRLESKHCAQ